MKYIHSSTFPRQSANMIHIRCVGGSKHGKWTDIPEDYLRRMQFEVAVPKRVPVTHKFCDLIETSPFTEETYRIEPVACQDVVAYIAIIDDMSFDEASNRLMWLAVTEELR